ncbi:MAG TPA: hypothetical protein PLG55_06960 [Methanospirillum sp.]|jgi:hypothetical protein|nr:hypothetical protein [Methanospirillum sp.]HPY60444.1 hypothetical protein [Methanospirillum sp.]
MFWYQRTGWNDTANPVLDYHPGCDPAYGEAINSFMNFERDISNTRGGV